MRCTGFNLRSKDVEDVKDVMRIWCKVEALDSRHQQTVCDLRRLSSHRRSSHLLVLSALTAAAAREREREREYPPTLLY